MEDLTLALLAVMFAVFVVALIMVIFVGIENIRLTKVNRQLTIDNANLRAVVNKLSVIDARLRFANRVGVSRGVADK
ncbi:hypothetical protein AAEJ42_02275 [Shewanella algae]|uniref:hypothetical protein n=1 Tax=Shewanella algae TaxID=38313 RepID=UPI00313E22CC